MFHSPNAVAPRKSLMSNASEFRSSTSTSSEPREARQSSLLAPGPESQLFGANSPAPNATECTTCADTGTAPTRVSTSAPAPTAAFFMTRFIRFSLRARGPRLDGDASRIDAKRAASGFPKRLTTTGPWCHPSSSTASSALSTDVPQNTDQLKVKRAIRRQQLAAERVERAAAETGHTPARLFHQQRTGSHVPAVEGSLPESVEAACRHIREIEGGRPQSAHRSRACQELAEDRQLLALRGVGLRGEPRHEQRIDQRRF